MLKGSCACGKIRYEIRGGLSGPVSHCHCRPCRKQSGSAFNSTARLDPSTMNVLAGWHLVRSWRRQSGTEHFFASCCGSPLYVKDADEPGMLLLPLGTLDDDPEILTSLHVETGSKAPWLTPWNFTALAASLQNSDPAIASLWVTPQGVPHD